MDILSLEDLKNLKQCLEENYCTQDRHIVISQYHYDILPDEVKEAISPNGLLDGYGIKAYIHVSDFIEELKLEE